MTLLLAYMMVREESTQNGKNLGPMEKSGKRTTCRYGRGCTHIADEAHCARYWHPAVPLAAKKPSENAFVCNECGFVCDDPRELQFHMQRKTAWSNRSLVGCHVSVLLDNRDWQDGIVTQFHKCGKHCVDFHLLQQKRWLHMLKTAFYIVQRPQIRRQHGGSESKEPEDLRSPFNSTIRNGIGEICLAPIDKWSYCEEVSLEYVA